MTVFASTLNQIMVLFSFIAIGYLLAKLRIVGKDGSTILARLENNIFIPALVFNTFINNFTVESFSSAGKVLLISTIIFFAVAPIAIGVSKLLVKDKYIQNIFTYGLAFSNFGFMGNAVVSVLFPDIFFEYLIFTLPLWVAIYLWGVPVLLISDSGEHHGIKQRLKSFVNPMFIAMIIGMILGLSQIPLPKFIGEVVSISANCMSPIAMILTGITVAQISLKTAFTDIKIYAVSIVRLVIIPVLFIAAEKVLKLPYDISICALCSLAMPLGLNTIVIPSAYGKDATAASSMALLSHLLSVITIPLIFMFTH